jgi:hypothetical protein
MPEVSRGFLEPLQPNERILSVPQVKPQPLAYIYEGESVNRSQVDIKRKTFYIQTCKNIYVSAYPPPTLIHLSHRFTSASKLAA